MNFIILFEKQNVWLFMNLWRQTALAVRSA